MPASASTRHSTSDLGELAGSDAELATEVVERLAAGDAEDDLGLAAAGPSALVGSLAFVGSARGPRSLRRRRRLVSWLLHGVVHCALESQMGVSGGCAAHQTPVGLIGIRRMNGQGVSASIHCVVWLNELSCAPSKASRVDLLIYRRAGSRVCSWQVPSENVGNTRFPGHDGTFVAVSIRRSNLAALAVRAWEAPKPGES
jgi:hypothetical protein